MAENARPKRFIEATRRAAAIAAQFAAEVDRDARFPSEAIDALKHERLLGAAVAEADGGFGCSVAELTTMCDLLGQGCGATAMVFAMHQIQVACLVRHARRAPFFAGYLAELCEHQLLLASVTSEANLGGDLRTSCCAVERDGQRFVLQKDATTISYGEQADALLVTTRRVSDAAPSDQVLVLLRRSDYTLERTSSWDMLGMRGTCSPGFKLMSRGGIEQILPVPFADIAARTMVPWSHILWSGCWLGIASDAVARARAFVRMLARQKPGVLPSRAMSVSDVAVDLQGLRTHVHALAMEYDRLVASGPAGEEELVTVGHALKMNNLKIDASRAVVKIVGKTLEICGMAGYRIDSRFSVGRHLRDAHSAAIMISNDRILATNAYLLLVHKDHM